MIDPTVTSGITLSMTGGPEKVFVPLAEIDAEGKLEGADGLSVIPVNSTASIEDAIAHIGAIGPGDDVCERSDECEAQGGGVEGKQDVTADPFRKGLESLPVFADALTLGVRLAEENEQLKLDIAALRLIQSIRTDDPTTDLAVEIVKLKKRVNSLKPTMKALNRKTRGKRPLVFKAPRSKGRPQGCLDIDRLLSLAIALAEGGDAGEIAGQLLDEVDRVQDAVASSRSPQGRTAAGSSGGGDLENKVSELEGVLGVTLGRLEDLEMAMRRFKAARQD